ncbi:MAG: aldo/keto reductase [Longibaculum muris]|uniref:Diketogulonate reductase-like aldo/keto reductase n=1 Tax=Longibaculum muris TaxID=1796628 RepID=A0A4R3ZAK0_9FIRM|nr:aldo/keto reductase [Longibaculum muris]MBS5369257.1 aldo/keto reductase [Coprobacillus cateniformis]MCR1887222.1 aldo/keto reductase [Longibaculum muris]MED9812013.1 aldo/keto reductase [Longibaculum muris]TCW02206.1 diketogulonate reductase-like aldo/keto reductase [Longibaculum muris]
MEKLKLNNGIEMPQLGFGVFQITDYDLCKQSVKNAFKIGYRLIDTAACYGNEKAVGDAIRESQLTREELFISSKVWIQKDGYEGTKQTFMKSLDNLQTDYIDLYLIHMPYGDYHGSWRALEELYKEGKIKAIGVCNFLADRLVDLILTHDIVPAINQMELHPFYQQKELKQVMLKYDIQMMAWAPFAEGNRGIFTDEQLQRIGSLYQKTPAQVILRWLRQNHIIAIPKSIHEDRMIQNYSIDDFELSQEDMLIIEKMDENKPLILEITALNEVYRLHGIQ